MYAKLDALGESIQAPRYCIPTWVGFFTCFVFNTISFSESLILVAHCQCVFSFWFGFVSFFTFFTLFLLLLLRTETSYKFSANKENSTSFQLVVLLSALNFHPFIYLFSYSFSFFCCFFGFIANEVSSCMSNRGLEHRHRKHFAEWTSWVCLKSFASIMIRFCNAYEWSKCRNSSTELLSVMCNSSLAN